MAHCTYSHLPRGSSEVEIIPVCEFKYAKYFWAGIVEFITQFFDTFNRYSHQIRPIQILWLLKARKLSIVFSSWCFEPSLWLANALEASYLLNKSATDQASIWKPISDDKSGRIFCLLSVGVK